MAQQGRARRAAAAARRRARRRAFVDQNAGRRTDRSAGFGSDPSAGPADTPPRRPEIVSALLLSAADEDRAGDPDSATRTGVHLADRCRDQPGVIETGVRCAVAGLIGAAWRHGWTPEDLHQIARRRLDSSGIGYLIDAIADESQQHAAAGMHERWCEQLRQLEAVVWWAPGQGHLAQWAQRYRRDQAAALATVIKVLALLQALPMLPRVVPPPGSAPARPSRPDQRRGIDQKVLARIRGLLAKAESTTFPEEAEALSAKAQELMSRYSLERIVGETEAGSGPPPSGARRIWLDSPYVAAKALLVDAVAEANRCRAALSEKLGFITVVGDEVDLDLVEVLTTSLLVQATRALMSAGAQITRTGQSRTRSFRNSFLISYATRIRERLTVARDSSTAGVADPARLLPVLAARERVVNDLFDSMFRGSGSRSFSVGNAAGWHAGRAAADLAVLDARRSVDSGHPG